MNKIYAILGLIAVSALITATSVSMADASSFKNQGECMKAADPPKKDAKAFCDQFKPKNQVEEPPT